MYSLFQTYQDMYFIDQEKKSILEGEQHKYKRIDRNSQDFTHVWIRVSLCIENYRMSQKNYNRTFRINNFKSLKWIKVRFSVMKM